MKNEDTATIVENANGRFTIIYQNEPQGSYSRQRDAVRAAKRKGFTLAV